MLSPGNGAFQHLAETSGFYGASKLVFPPSGCQTSIFHSCYSCEHFDFKDLGMGIGLG